MSAGVVPMSVLATTIAATSRLLPGAEHGIDDKGYTSHHWLWPEQAELIYGTLASVIIIGLLVWKAGPFAKKAFNDRTAKVQGELDDSAKAQTDAEAEAARIRQALGDIEGERTRLLAEADAQAEALVADGRTRLAAEIADIEAKADADIGRPAAVWPTSCASRSPGWPRRQPTRSWPTRSTTPRSSASSRTTSQRVGASA